MKIQSLETKAKKEVEAGALLITHFLADSKNLIIYLQFSKTHTNISSEYAFP